MSKRRFSMDDSHIEDELDEVQNLFDRRPEEVETGLDVDDPGMLQLRKACRLLEAGRQLIEENGYYTVVIETSFGAIERSLQFYLLENDFLHPDEYIDHQSVYEESYEAGLYNQEFRDKLVELWRNNRSRSYYREGVGTTREQRKCLD
jgi:hypothetical protein